LFFLDFVAQVGIEPLACQNSLPGLLAISGEVNLEHGFMVELGGLVNGIVTDVSIMLPS
jgi:hypothetical protein